MSKCINRTSRWTHFRRTAPFLKITLHQEPKESPTHLFGWNGALPVHPVITDQTQKTRQCVQFLSICIMFYYFAISSQVTKASSEQSLQLYHPPNLIRVPREKHASLQTAYHVSEAHTATHTNTHASEKIEHSICFGG